jgi:hypothetical protein
MCKQSFKIFLKVAFELKTDAQSTPRFWISGMCSHTKGQIEPHVNIREANEIYFKNSLIIHEAIIQS